MIPPSLFLKAAEALQSGRRDADSEAAALLAMLDYDQHDGEDNEKKGRAGLLARRVALLKAAAKLERIFQLDSLSAPGLVFLGAEFRVGDALDGSMGRVSATGKGVTLREAFESCVGETVEYLSQLESGNETLEAVSDGLALSMLDANSQSYIERVLELRLPSRFDVDWVRVSRLSDGSEVFLPADICLRRPSERQQLTLPFALSTGTAAGPSLDRARAHALLELIERDALALWWKGGRRGRSVNLDDADLRDVADFLRLLRQDDQDRRTWLLDIATDIGVPCVVAVSCASGGGDFAFGAAARMTMAAAAKAALLEVCQMELAYAVVQAKIRERGEAALNAADRGHLARSKSLDVEACLLLHPAAGERAPDCALSIAELITRCSRLGIEIYALDITRAECGVPAVRLIAPALQLEPSELASERLAQTIAQTGGGYKFTNGVRLL